MNAALGWKIWRLWSRNRIDFILRQRYAVFHGRAAHRIDISYDADAAFADTLELRVQYVDTSTLAAQKYAVTA